jgi:hypothetical protein
MPDITGDLPPPRKFLRCYVCDRERDCSETELLSFVGDGWPTCCGQTMALLVEAVASKPAPDGKD